MYKDTLNNLNQKNKELRELKNKLDLSYDRHHEGSGMKESDYYERSNMYIEAMNTALEYLRENHVDPQVLDETFKIMFLEGKKPNLKY